MIPSDCLAVHYADLGMLERSFGVLGRCQTLMSEDSYPLDHPQDVATKYLKPGEEADAPVDLTGAIAGQSFPLLDLGHHLHTGPGAANNVVASQATGMALGGQLTLLQVPGTAPASRDPIVDRVGLDHTTVAVTFAGTAVPGQLTLSVDASGVDGASIASGEYTLDAAAPPGAGTPAPTLKSGSAVISTPSRAAQHLSNGDHTIWVRETAGVGAHLRPRQGPVRPVGSVGHL